MGTESCWDWWAIESVIYITGRERGGGGAPTQVQIPMLLKIVGKQIQTKSTFLDNAMPKGENYWWSQVMAHSCEGDITNYKHTWGDK